MYPKCILRCLCMQGRHSSHHLQHLHGYEESIKETGRETSARIEIDEELKNILDSKLQLLMEKVRYKPEVNFTYFLPDAKKEGGTYTIKSGIVKKVDIYSQIIHLVDETEIPISDVIDISGDIFAKIED